MSAIARDIWTDTVYCTLCAEYIYWSVTEIVQPIREIVPRGEETIGHSVRPKWN